MKRPDIRRALGSSLKAEEQAVKNKFEKAEAYLGKKTPAQAESRSRRQAKPKPKQQRRRVVLDAFTFPHQDHELLTTIKKRVLQLGVGVSKSEVVRAGLHALNRMPDKHLLHIIEGMEKLKAGRPPASSES